MCFECRVLGALAPQSSSPSLPSTSEVLQADFVPSESLVKEHLVDFNAEAYLEPCLAKLRQAANVNLRAVKVDSDGSCLPYAVSRCLVGKEILYDALRDMLVRS